MNRNLKEMLLAAYFHELSNLHSWIHENQEADIKWLKGLCCPGAYWVQGACYMQAFTCQVITSRSYLYHPLVIWTRTSQWELVTFFFAIFTSTLTSETTFKMFFCCCDAKSIVSINLSTYWPLLSIPRGNAWMLLAIFFMDDDIFQNFRAITSFLATKEESLNWSITVEESNCGNQHNMN